MDNVKLYKLRDTPSGKALYAYMAAILEVMGMDQARVFPLNRFFKNISGHIDNGRIARVDGGYQLTAKGQGYFRDRYALGSPQYITRAEVDAMIKGIREGGQRIANTFDRRAPVSSETRK